MNNAREILQNLGERLQGGANVKNVFGEPITVDGKTVIPVARVHYGFGGGGGGRHGDSEGDEHEPHRAGWGGGGGVHAEPVGVLEITATETRFIYFLDPKRIGMLLGAGFLLGMMFSRMRRRRKG